MIYNFNALLKDKKSYEETLNELNSMLLETYSKRKMLTKVEIGSESFEATLSYVLLNLFLIKPFVGLEVTLTKDELFNSPTVTQKSLENHFNMVLEKFEAIGVKDLDAVRETICETLNELSDISGKYNKVAGNSISYTDFVKLAVNDPEANALFHPEIKEGQYSEIEAQFKEEGKKLIKYFEEHPETELYPFVSSETGINTKQFTQFAGFIGLKPDVTGNVIPVTVQDNFLNGLKNLESYYINCKRHKTRVDN